MQVGVKGSIGGIIGIITTIAVLSGVFHINVLPTLGVIGFVALISIPLILYSRTCTARSRQKVINVCIHDLELARKRLETEGKISEKDALSASSLIEDGEICVYLLNNINWVGTIPTHVSSLVLHTMQSIADRSDDILDVNRDW
jgi:uncharacterized protein YacL